MVHAISYLDVWCDRQFSKKGMIVEEYIGVNRYFNWLIINTFPWMEYHARIWHGISERSHGRKENKLGGIGK